MHTIRVDILTAFLTLLIISSAATILYTFRKQSDLIFNFSKDQMENISILALTKTMNLLDDSQTASHLGTSLIDKLGDVNLQNKDLIHFMIAILKNYPYVENYYIGTIGGSYLSVVHLSEELIPSTRFAPKGTEYRIQYIDRSKNPVEDTKIYLDKEEKEIKTVHMTNPEYDPRGRPWFQKAEKEEHYWTPLYPINEKVVGFGRASWSGIYRFEYLDKLGVTVSDTIKNDSGKLIGVVGTDLTLDSISEFLKTQKIGKTGSEIIIDPEGLIIAGPHLLKEKRDLLRNKDLTIYNSKNKTYVAALEEYKKDEEDYFIFTYKRKDYLASYMPFPERFDQDWRVLITVPFDDYFGAVIKTHLHSLMISVGIFIIASLLVILLARRVSRPIVRLSHEIDEIRNFHLDDEIDIRSNISEIHLIANATRALQGAIRQFSFFVPKELVRKLITEGKDVGLGGQKKSLSILFCDVKNFTGICEKFDPESLMIHISEYLDTVSRVILDHKGTIDKYIGDNVMAFWGAPEEDRESAFHSCRAALLMIKRLDELNLKWKNEGKPEFHTRIAIHKDEVVVGTVGTFERRNYTIIGDGVNLAARLEPVNKRYGTSILISETVYEEVKSHFITRPLDIVSVRGREEKTKVYELVGDESIEELRPTKEEIDYCNRFTQAFDLYYSKKFKEALPVFEELLQKHPDDLTCNIYIECCQRLIQNPPGDDWNPASHMKLC